MFWCGVLCDYVFCSVLSCSVLLVFWSVMLCRVMLFYAVFVEAALFCYAGVLLRMFFDVLCSVMLCSMLCHVLLLSLVLSCSVIRVLFCHALLSDVVLCRIRRRCEVMLC